MQMASWQGPPHPETAFPWPCCSAELWAYSFFSGHFFADQLTVGPRENKIQWCAVGKDEKSKCDRWSVVSNGEVECTVADNTKDCIVKIMVGFFFPFLLPRILSAGERHCLFQPDNRSGGGILP